MMHSDFENKCPICKKGVRLEATDEESKIHPSSIYGITKQVQEQMILLSCKTLDIPTVVFRYQNVYGPGQSLKNPYTGILLFFLLVLFKINLSIYLRMERSLVILYT
jgi:dTDP-L-rhamnose 4-epimerase